MTLPEYSASITAGTKLTLTLSDGTVLRGRSGSLPNGRNEVPVIKFKDGTMVQVTENLVGLIEVERTK